MQMDLVTRLVLDTIRDDPLRNNSRSEVRLDALHYRTQHFARKSFECREVNHATERVICTI